jgi:hypothetical protein
MHPDRIMYCCGVSCSAGFHVVASVGLAYHAGFVREHASPQQSEENAVATSVVIPCSVCMPSMHCYSTTHVLVLPAHTLCNLHYVSCSVTWSIAIPTNSTQRVQLMPVAAKLLQKQHLDLRDDGRAILRLRRLNLLPGGFTSGAVVHACNIQRITCSTLI